MTVDQLNRTKLDPPSFRLYAALLCESDMSVNRIAYKTGMTRRTISKKLPLLLDKDLAVKTNNRSKVPTYSGIDPTELNDSTVELNDTPIHESNSTTGESFDSGAELNDSAQDDFNGELGGIWEKYS
jgi:DNA-binding transcriptional ArsR family regulator